MKLTKGKSLVTQNNDTKKREYLFKNLIIDLGVGKLFYTKGSYYGKAEPWQSKDKVGSFQFRFDELDRCMYRVDKNIQKCMELLPNTSLSCAEDLMETFNHFIYLKKNFYEHQEAHYKRLDECWDLLDDIDDVEVLKDCYDFLKERYVFRDYLRRTEGP